MNKKGIIVLIICFAPVLYMGNVSAANMVNKDFDGFSMDVPKNVDFEKIINDEGNEYFIVDSVSYLSEMVIFYKILQFVMKIHFLIFY